MVMHMSQFRNWRIVEAADSEGVRRKCFLLPMEMNGIFISPKTGRPYMRYNVFRIPKEASRQYAYGIQPVIPYVVRDSLVEQGLLAPDARILPRW